MANRTCVKKPINFVHAKDEYQSTSGATSSCKKKSEHPQLDGRDIKSFYEEVVASSSSQNPVKKDIQENRHRDVSKAKHKHAHPVQRKHTSSHMLRRTGRPSSDAGGVEGSPAISDSCSKTVKSESIGKETPVSSKSTAKRNENKFLRCAQDGDLNELRRLVEDGVDVNAHDAYGWTALMCASHTGHLPVIQYLVDSGARWTTRDSNGRSPIDIARLAKQHHVVKYYENIGRDSDLHREENHSECRPFYCEICQAEFKDTGLDAHNASTVHLFNRRLPRKPTTYFLPENNKGFQMMLRAGWDKEKGLGSKEQGHKFPVKTVLKRDRHGLGVEEERKAKVTHFGPNDRKAVQENGVKRTMKATTLSANARERTLTKEKRKERTFRMAFNMD